MTRYLHAALRAAEGILRRTEQGRAWFLARGVPAVYSRLHQPELARCLRLLAETNGEALYRGEIASAIVDALAGSGGFLVEDDLAAHTTRLDAPLTAHVGDLELLQPPPNSQGVVLLEALRLAEARTGAPFPDLDDADELHVLVESVRAALADRDAAVADPDLSLDAAHLIDDRYVTARAASIDTTRAAASWEPGVGRAAAMASSRDGDTANLVAIDADGLAVSLTQSLYCDFGSGVPVPRFGFMLQNRGACFSLSADARNAIGPGRRPLHTLMPGMAVAGGDVRYVFGCMGGHGQAQTQAQILARLAAGADPQEAVAAPRFFADPEAAEPVLYVEQRVPASLRDQLAQRGHPVRTLGDWEEIMGHAQLAALEPSGALVGAGDPRTDGAVAAW